MTMHVKWPVHMSMLLVLLGTVRSSRPSPGIVLGKSVDFRLNKNWRPSNTRHAGTRPIISREVTDDEDLIIEGSGVDTLSADKSPQTNLHSSAGTHMSCCSVGYSFGESGIHCNEELHYSRLAMASKGKKTSYGDRLRSHLKKHGTDIPVMNFKRCLERRPNEFHKCCYVAKHERESTRRWQKHHRKSNVANDKRYISWKFVKG